MRAAIYYAPAPGTEIAGTAAEWLGRDAFSGEATREADGGIDPLVAEPARYGFHATMKAPFRLADGCNLEVLSEALAAFTARRDSVTINTLALQQIDGFFALVPADAEPELDALAAETVEAFEPFRAPLTSAERDRRRPERLSERERELLDRYGYPYVLDAFRFHMTLTGRIGDGAEDVGRILSSRFAFVIDRPLPIDALTLFVEPEPGAPFRAHARHAFQSPASEPSAP
ncbi:DUF1045 domain-containing protein [Aureimonas mangrovi]|uniref:DUF1045 domain-containing protein n=1 Tax=Aureimonas mangrovi TaxID=2758041 RepID=UPI00163DD8EE|nr:DUF1045 domain-containing protein [Aureimonas mangrovi]